MAIRDIQKEIQEQSAWIEQCGGTLMGYIHRYGSKEDLSHSGDGGEAIYEADSQSLFKLMAEVKYVRRRISR